MNLYLINYNYSINYLFLYQILKTIEFIIIIIIKSKFFKFSLKLKIIELIYI